MNDEAKNDVLCFPAGGMAKRIADKELTDRNWDQEEEGEEVSDRLHRSGFCLSSFSLEAVSPSQSGVNLDLSPPPPPQAGTFSIASVDVLKNRAIKKAKRRNTGGEVKTSHRAALPCLVLCSAPFFSFQSEGSTSFKGFKGFSLTPSAGGSGPTPFSGFGTSGAFTGLTNGNAPPVGGVSAPTHSTGEGKTEEIVTLNAFMLYTAVKYRRI